MKGDYIKVLYQNKEKFTWRSGDKKSNDDRFNKEFNGYWINKGFKNEWFNTLLDKLETLPEELYDG
jgi:hypothetical protein